MTGRGASLTGAHVLLVRRWAGRNCVVNMRKCGKNQRDVFIDMLLVIDILVLLLRAHAICSNGKHARTCSFEYSLIHTLMIYIYIVCESRVSMSMSAN